MTLTTLPPPKAETGRDGRVVAPARRDEAAAAPPGARLASAPARSAPESVVRSRATSAQPSVPAQLRQTASGAVPSGAQPSARPATPGGLRAAAVPPTTGAAPRTAAPSPGSTGTQGALLRLQAATLSHVRFESAAIAFCSELAEILDASRVALGMIRNRHSELVAVSRGGPEQLDRATTKAILAAMDEAYDQASTVVAPADERDRRISRATESLRRAHHGIVLVVPMAVDQAIVGAVTVELSDPKRPVAPVAALVEDAAALFGPALNVLQLNERPLWRRLRDDARTSAALWAAPARRPWRWAIGSLAAAMALLAFVPMGVSVSAPARVEGAVQRVVAAPAAGFLKSAAVRPGDAVKAGQTVAELLDRDLLLDRNKLLSEIAQHENAYAASMARADRANMMIYQAKLAEARAQADLVEQQLARIRMTAPIDGVVIQGDLSQSIGSPVEKGQTLMTIAPRDAFRVIVELDERDALMVRAGQTGNLSLSALPWDSTPVRLERVTPMATVIDGRNVFEIEATPLGDPKGLRAGLRGIARVDVDRAPPLRVWLRRLSDHTLRFLWRWLP